MAWEGKGVRNHFWVVDGIVGAFMGFPRRATPGKRVYHVLNRANGRRPLFDDNGDYAAFERSAKWFLTPFRAEWDRWVNEPETPDELTVVHRSVMKGQPFGSQPWVD